MPDATIIRAWTDSDYAYLAVRIAEADVIRPDNTEQTFTQEFEYVGKVPLRDEQGVAYFAQLGQAAQRNLLLRAVREERRNTRPRVRQNLAFSGTVTVED